MKIFLAFLLGVILTVASFGLYQFYVIQNNTTVPVTKPDITIPVTTQPTMPVNTDTPKTNCAIEEIAGTGYTFCAPLDHNITKNTLPDNSKKFIFTSRTTGDTITVEEKLKSVSYTDSDSKFGDVKVAYNTQKNIWEATGACDSPVPCNRSLVTNQRVQVFIGRSRWLTYIVPLDNVGILVFNSTGGGFVKPLEELIQTLKITK
ncbi:MAG: hypothetical protein WC753_00930 [Candidatus Gracilibacteria bacterium]|jgi:hypothetical protein